MEFFFPFHWIWNITIFCFARILKGDLMSWWLIVDFYIYYTLVLLTFLDLSALDK